MPFTPETIAKVTGEPVGSVALNWPLIEKALEDEGISSQKVQIAAIATIATEVPRFEPISEFGNTAYFTKQYEGRSDLGNAEPGDGAKYHGRGYVQITGRANYARFGKALGLDLENEPELALQPDIAAQIFALYFRVMRVHLAAEACDWKKVRKLVNGGLNGWDRFESVVQKLLFEANRDRLA